MGLSRMFYHCCFLNCSFNFYFDAPVYFSRQEQSLTLWHQNILQDENLIFIPFPFCCLVNLITFVDAQTRAVLLCHHTVLPFNKVTFCHSYHRIKSSIFFYYAARIHFWWWIMTSTTILFDRMLAIHFTTKNESFNLCVRIKYEQGMQVSR